MVELSKEQYYYAKHLLPTEEGYVAPKAVVCGNNPGWVFVDSLPSPKIMIVWAQGNNGFYFIGMDIVKYADEINLVIDLIIKSRLLSKGTDCFEFSSVPPVTDEKLKSIFNLRKLKEWTQTTFTFKKSMARVYSAPFEGQLWDIRELEKNYSLINTGFVHKKILKHWESLDAFFAKANGFFIIVDNAVASFAFTGWIANNVHEISIETMEAYRRKGFAKVCAAKLVNYYLQNGFSPYWECASGNTASVKIAQTLGFTQLSDYTCYAFKL